MIVCVRVICGLRVNRFLKEHILIIGGNLEERRLKLAVWEHGIPIVNLFNVTVRVASKVKIRQIT